MRKFRSTLFLVAGLFLGWKAFGQSASFTNKGTVCLGESIKFTNTSTGSSTYQWDFCHGDLDSLSVNTSVKTVLAGDFPIDVQVEYDLGNWYGFTVDFLSFKMLRLNYGGSLTNTPTVTEVNVSGLLSNPSQTKLLKVGGVWYGFATNYSGPDGLVRLVFGNGLGADPTAVQGLGSFASLSSPMSLEILDSGGDYTIAVYSSGTPKISLIHFGSSLLNNPTNSDVIETGGSVGLVGLSRLSVRQFNGNWFGLVNSVNDSKVYRMQMGAVVFDNATSFDLVGSIPNPEGVELIEEGGKYYGLVAARTNGIYKIDFGSDPAGTGTITPVGKLGVTDEFRSLDLVRDSPGWRLFSVSRNGAELYRMDINDRGTGTPLAPSTSFQPTGVRYQKPGQFKAELTAFSVSGNQSVASTTITAQNKVAPALDLTTTSICVGTVGTFQAVSTSTLVTFSWDFNNDGIEDSNTSNPTYNFPGQGTYPIGLTAVDANGCTGLLTKQISAFNAPVPDFILPAGLICTNNVFAFVNSTVDTFAGNLSYQWLVDGNSVATTRDLNYAFTGVGDKSIKMRASIPGCLNEVTKTVLNVLNGPTVAFAMNGQCEGDVVSFANGSSGTIAGYSWNFGNGQTSTGTNPTSVYGHGDYLVTLITTAINGCQSSLTKNLKIYSKPQPDFSIGLPPFSCAGTPSPLADLTPGLTDSNIIAWSWQFGDASNSTSQQRNPAFTYAAAGNYIVSLQATSDAGCANSVQKTIVISASPQASFANSPACLNQTTRFTDLSSGGVVSRTWQIANTTFTTTNPSFLFSAAGNYTTSLTVSAANGCISTLSRSISVPNLPVLNFSIDNACAGSGSIFTDLTQGSDAVTGWNWLVDTNALTGNPVSYTFPLSGTFAAKLTTTHASGCSYAFTRNVIINPSPVASFTASPDRGAAPLTVQFTNTSTGATAYAWKFLDKVPASSTRPSPVYTFAALGTYAAELTATNDFGCQSVVSKPIVVLVPAIDLNLTDFSLLTDPITGNMKCQVTILNNSNIPIDAATVALYLGGKAVVNETVPIGLSPGTSATRTLSFTVAPGSFDFTFLCAEVQHEKDLVPDNNRKCVNLASGDYFFQPYPNPSAGVLQVDWIGQQAGTAVVRIFDDKGTRVFEWQTVTHVGLNQGVLDLAFLTSGLYYVQVQTGNASKTMRFMRQ